MRKTYLLFTALFSFTVLGTSQKANAQAAYAGNYNMLGGYTSGYYYKGLYFKGYVTAASNGTVSYSAYFPYSGYPTYGKTGYGTGKITASGAFSFLTKGVYGSVQLLLQKYGYGYFYDSSGDGYFGLLKT
ncbi:MAG: hypothetical protein EBT07_19020 [Actinobacteria bacterium]|nr:hypothetical protein [Actinomycetota bacterium]